MTYRYDRQPRVGGECHVYGAFDNALPLMPCDAADGFNFERTGGNSYCLTLAVPGFDETEIEVRADGGYLRIVGLSRLAEVGGDVLHRGLRGELDRTFLMMRPLDVTGTEVRCGLLRVFLREPPGAGVRAARPPELQSVEALALAA